jgi:hypothetical protein
MSYESRFAEMIAASVFIPTPCASCKHGQEDEKEPGPMYLTCTWQANPAPYWAWPNKVVSKVQRVIFTDGIPDRPLRECPTHEPKV